MENKGYLMINLLNAGKCVRRNSWEDKTKRLELINPYTNEHFELHEKENVGGTFMPYIGVWNKHTITPWTPTQEDLIADDWVVFSDDKINEKHNSGTRWMYDGCQYHCLSENTEIQNGDIVIGVIGNGLIGKFVVDGEYAYVEFKDIYPHSVVSRSWSMDKAGLPKDFNYGWFKGELTPLVKVEENNMEMEQIGWMYGGSLHELSDNHDIRDNDIVINTTFDAIGRFVIDKITNQARVEFESGNSAHVIIAENWNNFDAEQGSEFHGWKKAIEIPFEDEM